MPGLQLVAYVFGGAFLANAVPHLVSGMMGRPFQTPFAKPPGEGLSSSRLNVIWGFANLVIGTLLLSRIGAFDLRDGWDAGSSGLGAFLLSYYCAGRFGRFNGGNTPGA